MYVIFTGEQLLVVVTKVNTVKGMLYVVWRRSLHKKQNKIRVSEREKERDKVRK